MRRYVSFNDGSSELRGSRSVFRRRAGGIVVSAVVLSLLLPFITWGQAPLLLIATSMSQPIQNRQADAEHLSRMLNLKMIGRFRANGLLVRVPVQTRFYYLHAIQSSYRYLRPWAKLFLDRLSSQHYAKFRRRLRVTSLVRTVAFQRALARRNGNAAAFSGPLRSSHLTGATLDISKHDMTRGGISWMRKVLYSLRKNRYLYAIEEFQQPTFHVMVYQRYEEYVKGLKHRHKKREKPDEQIAARDDSNSG